MSFVCETETSTEKSQTLPADIPKYLKDLIKYKNDAEKQQKSGKLVDRLKYQRICKALQTVLVVRVRVPKNKADKHEILTRKVKERLGEYIEDLVVENSRNRLKYKTTQLSGFKEKHDAIAFVVRKLMKLYEEMAKK